MVSAATFRLPGPLAIAVAQVDAMSNGRITLALGAGWAEQEHLAYGIPFPPPGQRFDRLEEQLALITGMWKTPVGETFSFDGVHYQLVDCPALPKPVQQPHPPVIVGGTGPRRTPALAARFADEFNLPPFNAPDAAAAAFARVRAACEEIGRDPATLECSVTLTTVCGADRAEVERRGAVSPLQFQGADCAGTPDEVLEQLLAYREIGATRAYLRLLDLRDLEQIALLGDAVLPGVTTANAAGTPSAG
jgi:alkanesulfonate monooxygenase SsuD/methylene tetrahydromethanopterin reductase-like flavin-dependent oxidoreductase (luciferase family)